MRQRRRAILLASTIQRRYAISTITARISLIGLSCCDCTDGWLQDELKRFNDEKVAAAEEAGPPATWEPFTLHDFRRTAITALQMSGTTEKDASIMVGATPEVIRKHYEKLDRQAIARRAGERRLAVEGPSGRQILLHQSLRAGCAQGVSGPVDRRPNDGKVITA
jgi:hypothetical protein